MSEIKYGWIAFDRVWGFTEVVETEQWAREQAEEWLENYRGYPQSPWPMDMDGKIGYGEITIKAITKPSGDNDYQIVELEQPAGKVKA